MLFLFLLFRSEYIVDEIGIGWWVDTVAQRDATRIGGHPISGDSTRLNEHLPVVNEPFRPVIVDRSYRLNIDDFPYFPFFSIPSLCVLSFHLVFLARPFFLLLCLCFLFKSFSWILFFCLFLEKRGNASYILFWFLYYFQSNYLIAFLSSSLFFFPLHLHFPLHHPSCRDSA